VYPQAIWGVYLRLKKLRSNKNSASLRLCEKIPNIKQTLPLIKRIWQTQAYNGIFGSDSTKNIKKWV
jgi:hypothetical protein